MQLVIKKTSFYSILLTFMIVLLPLSNLPFLSLSISSYTDEVIGMLSIIFLIKKLLNQKLKIYPGKICILLIIIGIIGFLSSLFSGLSRSILIQLFDYFLFIKPYVIFIAFLSIDESIKEKVITFLYPISKAIIWILFICSFVSQFIDIGMTIFTTNLLGIKINIFGFIWNNGIQTAWLAVGCFACICYKCKEKNKFKVYLLLYISILITIWGGFISMLFFSSLFLLWLFKEYKIKKIKTWQLLILIMLGCIFAYSDISEYLINSSAPRAIFIKYGAITANSYFPLGSGLATYGSEMAKRYYSPLYYRYGFNNIWSLSYLSSIGKTSVCTLNDTYFSMIIGQFGWIGFLIFITILIYIFIIINNAQTNSTNSKAISLSAIITIFATMLASSTSNSAMGVFVYIIIGLSTSLKNNYKS